MPWATPIAAVLFAIAAATDFFDGRLARRWKQTTTLGTFLDTTADKLLVSGVLMALVAVGRASAWIAFIIIGRELVIMGLRGVVSAADGTVVKPSIWGKLKANVQFLAIFARDLGVRTCDRRLVSGSVRAWRSPPSSRRVRRASISRGSARVLSADRGALAARAGPVFLTGGIGIRRRRPAARDWSPTDGRCAPSRVTTESARAVDARRRATGPGRHLDDHGALLDGHARMRARCSTSPA